MINTEMNLRIFNTTHEELCSQKHHIFIGISVGVKPMSRDMAISYLEWALQYSTGIVQILIADAITHFNYLVFSHSTKPGALSRAIRDGDKYQEFFEKILAEFDAVKRCRFRIIRWKDIQSPRFQMLLKKAEEEFATNASFREVILSFVDKYVENRNRVLTHEKKLLLSQYLLHEFPTLLDGIYVNGVHYNLILYPAYKHSGMSELVAAIQNGNRFASLIKGFDLKKTIMVESIIEHRVSDINSILK